MRPILCRFFSCLPVVMIGVLISEPAAAYIDAGTGSMILQLVIAGIAGALLTIKVYWRRLMRLFGRKSGGDEKDGRMADEK